MDNNSIEKHFTRLSRSSFRSRFKLSAKDRAYIRDKGLETIKIHAEEFISSRIAPPNPKNDGHQTPVRNHPVFIAQHATATCCRQCLQKWYGISKDKPLTNEEKIFVVTLIVKWIKREMEEVVNSPILQYIYTLKKVL